MNMHIPPIINKYILRVIYMTRWEEMLDIYTYISDPDWCSAGLETKHLCKAPNDAFSDTPAEESPRQSPAYSVLCICIYIVDVYVWER